MRVHASWLTRLVTLLAAFTVAVSGMGASPQLAEATGVDHNLCEHDSSRVEIPADFVLDACFDGIELVLVNRTELQEVDALE